MLPGSVLLPVVTSLPLSADVLTVEALVESDFDVESFVVPVDSAPSVDFSGVLVDEPARVSAALARMAAAVLPIFRLIVLAAAAGSAAGEASVELFTSTVAVAFGAIAFAIACPSACSELMVPGSWTVRGSVEVM